MNTPRFVLAALVSGVVMAAVEGGVNRAFFSEQWMATFRACHIDPLVTGPTNGIGFTVTALVRGLVLVWTYVALVPRYGEGARTAAYAGLVVGVAAYSMYAAFAFTRIAPVDVIAITGVAGIAGSVVAAFLAAKIYRPVRP